MKFGDPLCDREAEAGAARVGIATATGLINAIKSLKYVLLLAGWDADATVGDRDLIYAIAGDTFDIDTAAGAGIFDRVVEHIEKHPPKKRLVTGERHFCLSIKADADLLTVGQNLDRPHRIACYLVQINRS